MSDSDKPLVWLRTELHSPPLLKNARIEAGYLLRRLQQGELLALPHSRPMPSIGPRCHELRVRDEDSTWRVVYRIDQDWIIIATVFRKKTNAMPHRVVRIAQRRLKEFDDA